jgi:hypothetical protein
MSANHLTGVDESVTVVVNGLPLFEIDTVTNFSVEDDVVNISYRPLGRSGSVYSQDFGGHTGSFTFVDSSSVYEDLKQVLFTAMSARIPSVVTLIHVINHKPAGVNQKVITYRDIKITSTRTVARDETTSVVVNWVCGSLRSVS